MRYNKEVNWWKSCVAATVLFTSKGKVNAIVEKPSQHAHRQTHTHTEAMYALNLVQPGKIELLVHARVPNVVSVSINAFRNTTYTR